MTRKNIFLFCILLLTGGTIKAQKDTLVSGMYLSRLYDFNLIEDAYSADFWIWFLTEDSTETTLAPVEITNSKSNRMMLSTCERREVAGKYWTYQHYEAKMHHDWDTRKFPFDKQILEIVVETDKDDTEQTILLDQENSGAMKDLVSQGWKSKSFNISKRLKHYKTNFGDPEISKGETAYEDIVLSVELTRYNRWFTLLKLIVGLWVAFMVAALAFLVPPIYNTPKFSASVGGLWAAIGNKHIADMYVPSTDSMSLIDALHVVTFVIMLAIISIAVVTLRFQQKEDHETVKKINFYGFRAVLCIYIVANVVLITWANF